MFKDSHVHTNLSFDATSDMAEYISCALGKQVDEIVFTEHFDFYDGVKQAYPNTDLDAYEQKYKKVKENSPIPIHFGIEIGLRPELKDKINEVARRKNFEFVIGSSHITSGMDIAVQPEFFEGRSVRASYLAYFEEMLQNVKSFDCFDVYGHLDYVVRYSGQKPLQKLLYKDYAEVLDEILKTIIQKGKGIEVNASGFRYGLGETHPNFEIVRRYLELGGEILTTGSDAHRTDYLALHFDQIYEQLRSMGVAHLTVFREKKPCFYKI